MLKFNPFTGQLDWTLSTSEVRESFSATTPVVYDSSTGIISFDVATTALTAYVKKTGDTMTGTLSINMSSDANALTLRAGGTSTSIKTLSLQDNNGIEWAFFRKRILSDGNNGAELTFNTSGTGATARNGFIVTLNSGFTGAEFTGALAFDTNVAGTATYYTADQTVYGYRASGNRGIGGYSRGVTTGHNVGALVLAGGGAINYGLWAAATIAKASAINVGVFGCAYNSSATSPAYIGGYFTMYNTATAPPNMTGIKTALLCDNQSFTDPIAIFRSNGTSFVSIEDTGDFLLGDRLSTTNLGTRFRIPATVQTTDATVTTVESVTTASDTSYTLHATVTAVKSDGSQMASYVLYASYRNDSGAVTQVGTTTVSHTAEDDATWDATLDISGTSIRVRVTGVAATTIRWQSHLRISAVKN